MKEDDYISGVDKERQWNLRINFCNRRDLYVVEQGGYSCPFLVHKRTHKDLGLVCTLNDEPCDATPISAVLKDDDPRVLCPKCDNRKMDVVVDKEGKLFWCCSICNVNVEVER